MIYYHTEVVKKNQFDKLTEHVTSFYKRCLYIYIYIWKLMLLACDLTITIIELCFLYEI